MNVERVVSDDAFSALHALLIEYERALPADLRHGSEPQLDELKDAYSIDDAAFLARADGAFAGCVVVTRLDPATAVLKRLYVRPEQRGHGAARALTLEAIAYARAKGYQRVVLDTDAKRLAAAHKLYLSMGFVEAAPYAAVGYASPTFMELRLR